MLSGDKMALARLMTYVENRHEDLLEIMKTLSKRALEHGQKIGITGPPGAGKSTLVDKIIHRFRKQKKMVGVIAIDPSSPFSGGAVLGDRIRMQDHNADDGVFIRSLGSRGAHGGLSRATREIGHLMEAFGFDVILIETVGVGQTELDIMSVADTTLVVLVPESGDTIQAMKAGLMEIADVFVVNKADRGGADQIFSELKTLSHMYSQDWEVPVLKSVALKGEGVEEIMTTLSEHKDFLTNHHFHQKEKQELFKRECLEIVFSELANLLEEKLVSDGNYKKFQKQLSDLKESPYLIASELLQRFSLK